ncbi:mannose-6-phosphate isomerase [Streptacidiphilus sp. PB12-B1b]|uniref:SIS domain-containing protein n=1 Tax=Streptacidiphilus sp. PB12-B1b TaxID=2705012 RepID=UPI0015F8DCB3|nr:SIS domain-containing protein [Streptacidiphilus sp. PB12-B1b]QMU75310.1 mannose-6-phosphate isomerase [Streptacidiphilus sp. PB12-B1b]
MFEEWLLDDPAALTRADEAGLLLDLASAGATVRRALRLAGEAGLDQLRPEGRPRAAFVAGHGTAVLAGELLAALGGTVCPVVVLGPALADPAHAPDRPSPSATPSDLRSDFALSLDWSLPGWAGPSDLLLILSSSGTEPGLITLAQQAYTRGCTVVSVAPAGSPLAGATLQVRGLPLPFEAAAGPGEPTPGLERDLPQDPPSTLWGLLAPMLALADRVGLVSIPFSSLQAAADQLDDVAVRCGPAADTYTNPAKGLAIQLDGVLPLIWSDSPGTAAVARRFAAMLADEAARPAVTGMLPEALTAQRGLLLGQLGSQTDEDDFFRDRTEETDALRYKLLLLRRTPRPAESPAPPGDSAQAPSPAQAQAPSQPPSQPEPDAAPAPEPRPTPHAVSRAHRLAADHQVGIQELTSSHTDALVALTELVALTDFAAVYLGLASSTRPRIH